jgi:putative drug exporter of the RND superfamily
MPWPAAARDTWRKGRPFGIRPGRAGLDVVATLFALLGEGASSTLFGPQRGDGDDPTAKSGRAAAVLRDPFRQGQPN